MKQPVYFLVRQAFTPLGAAFPPVLGFIWVHRTVFARDFNEACYRNLIVAQQSHAFIMEGPIGSEVFPPDPRIGFVAMASARPFPKHLKHSMADPVKDRLGGSVPVVIDPPSNNAGEFFYHLERRRLPVIAQVRLDLLQVSLYRFLARFREQLSSLTHEREAEKVEPFIEMNDTRFSSGSASSRRI